MKLQMDTLAYTNGLRSLPPEQKMIFAFTLLFIGLVAHGFVQVCIWIWMSIWIVFYAKIPLGTYIRLMLLLISFLCMSLPAMMISILSKGQVSLNHLDVWIGFAVGDRYIYVSHSGVKQAFSVLIRSLASVSCLYFLLLTVPFVEILQVMRRWRMPVIVLELLLLMYRFVFVLLETAEKIWIAQKSRGGHQGFFRSLKDLGQLLVQLFGKTMQRYQQITIGLKARGFVDEIQIVSTYPFVSSKRYVLEAIIGSFILLGLEWLTGAGLL